MSHNHESRNRERYLEDMRQLRQQRKSFESMLPESRRSSNSTPLIADRTRRGSMDSTGSVASGHHLIVPSTRAPTRSSQSHSLATVDDVGEPGPTLSARPSQESATSVQTTANASSNHASLHVSTRHNSFASNQAPSISTGRPASIRSVRSGRDFVVPDQTIHLDTASVRTVQSGQTTSRNLTVPPPKPLATTVSSTRAHRFSSLFCTPSDKFNSSAPVVKEYGLYVGDNREMIITYNANVLFTALFCALDSQRHRTLK